MADLPFQVENEQQPYIKLIHLLSPPPNNSRAAVFLIQRKSFVLMDKKPTLQYYL